MNYQKAYQELKNWELKLSSYDLALSLINFDKLTIAPKDGNEYRDLRTSFLMGEYFNILTDSKMQEIFEFLLNSNESDLEIKVACKKYIKDAKDMAMLDPKDVIDFQLLSSKSQAQWEKSKANNDYQSFDPYLKKIIEYRIKFGQIISGQDDAYNYYLDLYEPGLNQSQYDEFFNIIEEELVPLIKEVTKNQDKINRNLIKRHVDIDKQAKMMNLMCEYLGFDKSWGYMATSVHPFTNGFSSNDVRVTTAYLEDDISSALFSIIHEVGHAIYEHQMDSRYDGTILKQVSSGIHESQSRLLENVIGRNKSFWIYNYPRIQEIATEFKDLSLDDFYKAINASGPSPIRTEADELTYPIHILIRYEIEKKIFNHELDNQNLSEVWNKLYKEYLGIDIKNDSEGILQDVHWSDGSFGYFPTYALGSAVASQIYHKMNQDINVEEALETNNFKLISNWLKDNIQHYGALYSLNEILLKATGEKFNPKYYIEYLKDKYTKLYLK